MSELEKRVSTIAIQREVNELERLVSLLRRREELLTELATRGIEWASLPLPATDIIKMVADRHGFSFAEITGEGRDAPVVKARQEAMWLLREQKKPNGGHRFSLPQIGGHFCRDHTTVLHSLARHEERIANDKAA